MHTDSNLTDTMYQGNGRDNTVSLTGARTMAKKIERTKEEQAKYDAEKKVMKEKATLLDVIMSIEGNAEKKIEGSLTTAKEMLLIVQGSKHEKKAQEKVDALTEALNAAKARLEELGGISARGNALFAELQKGAATINLTDEQVKALNGADLLLIVGDKAYTVPATRTNQYKVACERQIYYKGFDSAGKPATAVVGTEGSVSTDTATQSGLGG